MVADQRRREGKVAFPDEEDSVGSFEGDWCWRTTTTTGVTRRCACGFPGRGVVGEGSACELFFRRGGTLGGRPGVAGGFAFLWHCGVPMVGGVVTGRIVSAPGIGIDRGSAFGAGKAKAGVLPVAKKLPECGIPPCDFATPRIETRFLPFLPFESLGELFAW